MFSVIAAEKVIAEGSLGHNVNVGTRPESVAVAPFNSCAKQSDLQKRSQNIYLFFGSKLVVAENVFTDVEKSVRSLTCLRRDICFT